MGQRGQAGEDPGGGDPAVGMRRAPRAQRRPHRRQFQHHQQVLGHQRPRLLDQHRIARRQGHRQQRHHRAEQLQRHEAEQADRGRSRRCLLDPFSLQRGLVAGGVTVEQIGHGQEVREAGGKVGGRPARAAGARARTRTRVVVAGLRDVGGQPVVGPGVVDGLERRVLDVADPDGQRRKQDRRREQPADSPGSQWIPTIPAQTQFDAPAPPLQMREATASCSALEAR